MCSVCGATISYIEGIGWIHDSRVIKPLDHEARP